MYLNTLEIIKTRNVILTASYPPNFCVVQYIVQRLTTGIAKQYTIIIKIALEGS